MHSQSIDDFRHSHVFLGEAHERNERKTWAVIAVCAAMMVAEIGGGFLFGSVALMADGLHMSTHAGALLIAALAYTYSRRYARDDRLAFGTGKLGDLAAFTSAIVLAVIALFIGYESIERLIEPVSIAFNQAIPIAAVGLGVNLLSAYLLRDEHDHGHAHHHHGEHDHSGHAAVHTDHNLRAAFVHVLADAAVSVLVIVGLVLGRQFGWVWMDPAMGLLASLVILNWSWTLIRSAGAILIDACPDPAMAKLIAARIEQRGDRISDLHLWRVGPGHLAAIIALVSDDPRSPRQYKRRLAGLPGLSHVTIEVERCPGEHPHQA
ncbi:MAG TPA: CDF family Co(II)/Ni(II) efflux transporter DmeF [Pseudolabrys sp.]|nr:CDF family Co(II)/Ni(II) efflux transporter DmeF [Pseudolabrys sp.]